MKRKTARKAARWWADKLRTPAKLDLGARTRREHYAEAFVKAIIQPDERRAQTREQIEAFEEALAQALLENDPEMVCTDYHPDRLLQEAARQVGLELGSTTLPLKTVMHIDGDTIRIACGYAASFETL